MDFIRGNVNLSEETWQKIQSANQTWVTEVDDEDMNEALMVNWH